MWESDLVLKPGEYSALLTAACQVNYCCKLRSQSRFSHPIVDGGGGEAEPALGRPRPATRLLLLFYVVGCC